MLQAAPQRGLTQAPALTRGSLALAGGSWRGRDRYGVQIERIFDQAATRVKGSREEMSRRVRLLGQAHVCGAAASGVARVGLHLELHVLPLLQVVEATRDE